MSTDYPWGSATVLAAELAADGRIMRANPALRLLAAPGTPFEALVVPAQREAFRERLAAADDAWTTVTFALTIDPGRAAADRTLWLRRGVVIAEPALGEQERLVEHVLGLNDDLVAAHRELVRQRERIAHLEAIASAGLAHLRLDDVLDEVLRTIVAAVGADRAAILLDDGAGALRVRAATGPGAHAGALAAAVKETGRPRVEAEAAAVPLRLASSVIGVLEVRARVTDDDLALLVPAGDRVAVAIARAQLHEREHAIAETLQRALLPDRLPEVEGLDLAARFTPGAQVDVGGDWYDALPLPSGAVAVAIGDVAGKGVRAAALMGEVRSGLRAYALEGGSAHEALTRLNGLVSRSRQMATVLLALVEPETGAIHYASAGHLPPLLVDAGGRAAFLDGGRSAPLLAYSGAEDARAHLERGAWLVLYTDGLVERREEPIDEGLERLRRAASGHVGSAAELCDRLLEAMHHDGVRDDTAIIALQRT